MYDTIKKRRTESKLALAVAVIAPPGLLVHSLSLSANHSFTLYLAVVGSLTRFTHLLALDVFANWVALVGFGFSIWLCILQFTQWNRYFSLSIDVGCCRYVGLFGSPSSILLSLAFLYLYHFTHTHNVHRNFRSEFVTILFHFRLALTYSSGVSKPFFTHSRSRSLSPFHTLTHSLGLSVLCLRHFDSVRFISTFDNSASQSQNRRWRLAIFCYITNIKEKSGRYLFKWNEGKMDKERRIIRQIKM